MLLVCFPICQTILLTLTLLLLMMIPLSDRCTAKTETVCTKHSANCASFHRDRLSQWAPVIGDFVTDVQRQHKSLVSKGPPPRAAPARCAQYSSCWPREPTERQTEIRCKWEIHTRFEGLLQKEECQISHSYFYIDYTWK